ncbi:ornithine carbamoyltransferase [Pradoshia sp.]
MYGIKPILKQKDFLEMGELTPEQLADLLDLAGELKARMHAGYSDLPLKGKILGMIFEKNSTRTRVSFETGMLQLGGSAIFLSSQDSQLGRGEPISDTAQVLSEYVDGLMIRTHEHKRAQALAENATVPVINGLTDLEHPCQALADLLTIKELKGELKGLKLAYIGDGNNVAHSLLIAGALAGMHVICASPSGYEPSEEVVEAAARVAQDTGAKVEIVGDPYEAVENADVIYCDVWTSMGQELENEKRLKDFAAYQVNEELTACAKEDYLFMHCLPAHRGEEVTASVIDSAHSVVMRQAGNRLHAQKALLVDLMATAR